MFEDIRGKEMAEIETDTLVRAVTIDAEDYTGAFIEKARAELAGRDVDVDSLRGRVAVASPDGVTTGTIDEALASVRAAERWTFRELAVTTGEALAINALAGCWSVRYRDAGGESVGVLAYRDLDELEETIRPLLELSPSWYTRARAFEDAKWEVLTTSSSIEHLVAVGEELARAELLYTIRMMSAREVESMTWVSVRRDGAQLLVPPDEVQQGERVLKTIDEEVEARFGEAEKHASAGDAAAELACYERLAALRPDDALVHYNRAAILLDLDRREAAAEAFMEAAPLVARDPKLLSYAGEVATHLEALSSDYPEPALVKHTLASLAMLTGDSDRAAALYGEIVTADDTDSPAHAALGRILLESGDDDEAARRHLARYIELEPDAPDRASVEHALEELRSAD